ncbi:hypothetical protein [Nonomuraea longicatena]|uniref:Tape measure protein n=1 Tax=Nonomuraea longicatena TaxID=83682 RepID=A0ABN1PZ05_9ACTN
MALNVGELYATLELKDRLTGPLGKATAGIKVKATGIHAAMIMVGMAAARMAGAVASGASRAGASFVSSGAKMASTGAKSAGLLAGVGVAGVAAGGVLAGVFAGITAGIATIGIQAAMSAPQVKAAFADLKTSVQADLADAASVFQGPLIAAAGQLKSMFSTQIAPALVSMFTTLSPLVGQFTAGLGDFLTPMLPAIQGVVAAVTPMLSVLAGSMGTFGSQLAGFLAPISQALSQSSGLLATLVTGVGGLLQALAPLLAAFVRLGAQVAGPLMSGLAMVGQTLSAQLGPVLVQLGPLIGQLITQFAQIAASVIPLLPPFLQLAAALAAALMPVLTQIVQALTAALQPILVALQPVLAALAEVFGQVIVALLPILPPISQLITSLLPVVVTLVKALTPILTMLATVFAKIVSAVTPFIAPLVQIVTALLPPLISLVQAVVKIFQGDLKGAIKVVSDAFSHAGRVIKENFLKIIDLGKNLLTGLWEGISSKVSWFLGKIGEFFSSILPDWVRDMLGIRSPSRVFAAIGSFTMLGFADGVTAEQPAVLRAADQATRGFGASFRAGLAREASGLSDAISGATPGKVGIIPTGVKSALHAGGRRAGKVSAGSTRGVVVPSGGTVPGSVTVNVTNIHPQAEPTSRTVNRGLQYAATIGLT